MGTDITEEEFVWLSTDLVPKVRFNGLELLMAVAPINMGLAALEKRGAEIGVARQAVQALIVAGRQHAINGTFCVAEGLVYDPKSRDAYLVPKELNPLLKHAPEVVEAHSQLKEFYVPEDEFSAIQEAVKDGGAIVMPKNKKYVSTSELASSVDGKFLFEEDAQSYAEFSQQNGASEFSFELEGLLNLKHQKAPFVRAVRLSPHFVGDWDELYGYGNSLHDKYTRTCGVRQVDEKRDAAENAAKLAAYEKILQKHEINSPIELADALENYSEIKAKFD